MFTFWLSHIPLQLFDEFWSRVDSALAPGGVVGFVDAEADHDIESVDGAPDIVASRGPSEGILIRKVGSGQEFPIVRITWTKAALRERLAGQRWAVEYSGSSGMLIGRATRQ